MIQFIKIDTQAPCCKNTSYQWIEASVQLDSTNKSDVCYIIPVNEVDKTRKTGSECHLHKPYWLAPCYRVFSPPTIFPTSTQHLGSQLSFWILDPLKMLSTGCPVMSARNYHYLLCNDPEERSSQMHTDYMEVLSDQYHMLLSIGLLVTLNMAQSQKHLPDPYIEN